MTLEHRDGNGMNDDLVDGLLSKHAACRSVANLTEAPEMARTANSTLLNMDLTGILGGIWSARLRDVPGSRGFPFY